MGETKPRGLKPAAFIFFLSTAVLLLNPQAGLSQTVDCRGTLRAWEADRSMGSYMASYSCSCPSQNAQPVCVKRMTGVSAKSSKKSAKLNTQKMIAATVVGSLLESVFSFDNSSAADDKARQEQLRQQEELERQELERKKQAAVLHWKALQQEEALQNDREAQQKQKAGQELLARMGSSRGGLTSFKWEKAQESELQYKPADAPSYPTSQFSQWQRLLCAAYFSGNALKATRGGNPEQARYLNEQADSVMAGQATAMECKPPAVPEPPTPKGAQNLAAALGAIQTKVQSLQEIETRLGDVKQKVSKAGDKKASALARVQELQTYVAAAKPEEKGEADSLLAEALAALQESEKELADATASEEALSREKDRTESDIRNVEKQLASGEDK